MTILSACLAFAHEVGKRRTAVFAMDGSLFSMFRTRLKQTSLAEARREFRWIKESLPANSVSAHDRNSALERLLERRLNGEPLAYVLGTQPFGTLEINIRPPTLIPRPETEDWTLRVSKLFQPSVSQPLSMLDLCTGSGCIPALLCHTWPRGSVRAVGVDVSPSAVELARENAEKFGLNDGTLDILQADVLDKSFEATIRRTEQERGLFSLLTANPPYIDKAAYALLDSSVKDYEDRLALLDIVGSGDGFGFYRRIAELAEGMSKLMVVCEVGEGQSAMVEGIFSKKPYVVKTAVWRDPWEKERVVLAWTT